jgi:hypothetical protein
MPPRMDTNQHECLSGRARFDTAADGQAIGWWRFSRCENQRRVQRRNAFRNADALRPSVPPATARAEFSPRENYHPSWFEI